MPKVTMEVVLCKDCKHRPFRVDDDSWVQAPLNSGGYDDWTCPFLCDDGFYSRVPTDDFFCADGELKTEEDNKS